MQHNIDPQKWRLVTTQSRVTGERREYGCAESWGRRYWTLDHGSTWWSTRAEARAALDAGQT